MKNKNIVLTHQRKPGFFGGCLFPMKMKFRRKPFSVYLKWIEPHKNREAIYVEGKNNGRIVAHEPLGLLNVLRKTYPRSTEARAQSRQTITNAGLENMVTTMIAVTELANTRGELVMKRLGEGTFDKQPVDIILRIISPEREDYPFHMFLVYIDKQRKIPLKIVGYGWNNDLLARYAYTDVKLNVGLTEEDFNIRNPEYDYPGILPFRGLKLTGNPAKRE